MRGELLNDGYALALEFGKNWRRPIIEIIQDMNTSLSLNEQLELSKQYLKQEKKLKITFMNRLITRAI